MSSSLLSRAKIVAVDRRRDLALIQIPKIPEGVKQSRWQIQYQTRFFHRCRRQPRRQRRPVGQHIGTVRSVYDKKFKSNHGEHEFRVVEVQSPIKPGDSGGTSGQ